MTGAQTSNVGTRQLYEAGDQRTSNEDHSGPPPFEAGQKNSHIDIDSKDQRTIGNRIASAQRADHLEQERYGENTIDDPLAPAQAHGNEPSTGAKVDAELQAEEEEYLRRKGKA